MAAPFLFQLATLMRDVFESSHWIRGRRVATTGRLHILVCRGVLHSDKVAKRAKLKNKRAREEQEQDFAGTLPAWSPACTTLFPAQEERHGRRKERFSCFLLLTLNWQWEMFDSFMTSDAIRVAASCLCHCCATFFLRCRFAFVDIIAMAFPVRSCGAL